MHVMRDKIDTMLLKKRFSLVISVGGGAYMHFCCEIHVAQHKHERTFNPILFIFTFIVYFFLPHDQNHVLVA